MPGSAKVRQIQFCRFFSIPPAPAFSGLLALSKQGQEELRCGQLASKLPWFDLSLEAAARIFVSLGLLRLTNYTLLPQLIQAYFYPSCEFRKSGR